ncbi:MAG: restriction endonuclease subunit S [Nitrospirae bacterium]|nr:restriction endonuclease subunit S [Nitrospirota bacterium]
MKPYPKYKESGIEWLGEIPEGWEVKPTKRLVSNPVIKGEGQTLLFVALEHIESTYGRTLPDFVWEDKEADDYATFQNGDVLFGKLRPYLRKFLHVDRKGCCPTELLVLRCNGKEIYNRFLFYLVQCNWFTSLANATSYGVKMPRTSWEEINNYYLWSPPISEQISIATYLDLKTQQIDALIAKKQRMIELLKEYRTAVINHAVTKGLNPNVKMKDSGIEWIGDIPEHWEVNRLKFLSNIKTGEKDTVNRDEHGEYPFFVRADTVERINSYSYDGEAVLTAGDGVGVGRVFHYVNGKFDYHQRVYKISDFRDITGKFFFYYMQVNFAKAVMKISAKSTVDSLRLPMFHDFPVVFGLIQEQKAVVSYLEQKTGQIDKQIENENKSIILLQEYRTALISNAVTGKIDLRDTVNKRNIKNLA